MKKNWPIFLASLLLLLGGIWAGYEYWLAENAGRTVSGKQLNQNEKSTGGLISDQQLAVYESQGLNPFGESTAKQKMTDAKYQEYIHGMAHQKVQAKEKWGFYQIHPKRIEWLLAGLDEVDLSHEDVYRRILTKWKHGDFSTADKDHNAIWKLQGGTIGKATDVFTLKEEKEYMNKISE
ncbi:DUF6241 domain-containing protein [Halobacillus salinarum]|uniref:DUF6241 domain-containing protein n=1 Tax=Halobacillus salinarum TaxID=2932257 RepID=A0ABY4EK94_9BACI|nr:DUF6241 domain-containing protein [Halobacillus salinarum]UOQ44503.1 DUF6241 domain-containing protein [Halobacillus salinarum]